MIQSKIKAKEIKRKMELQLVISILIVKSFLHSELGRNQSYKSHIFLFLWIAKFSNKPLGIKNIMEY